MKDFTGRLAVITGGGTGMGRELARQLVAEGCSVAMCDVSATNMAQTRALCEDGAPQGVRVTTHLADVSDEAAVLRFAAEVGELQETERINLLFNNAGIGGGGSFVSGGRAEWDKTFGVCWGGVYNCTRAFMPMLMAATEGYIVNTSSVNGFWASLGPGIPHTAYSAAKFAVKGFTEALITDLALNAPHIKVSLVMPGHIGTSIVSNSRMVLSGEESYQISAGAIAQSRARMTAAGTDTQALTDAQIAATLEDRARRFLEDAPTTAAHAATVILDGVRNETWRILVGDDAHELDVRVRADPAAAYDAPFFADYAKAVGWRVGG